MTEAVERTATATLSGRELALKRRKAMALQGKTAVAKTASARPVAPPRVEAAAIQPVSMVAPAAVIRTGNDDAALIAQLRDTVARSAARTRREAVSKAGKAALQPTAARPTPRPSGRVRPTAAAQTAPAGCGCGCNGAPGGCGAGVAAEVVQATPAMVSAPAFTAGEVGTRPAAETRSVEAPTGRALARARRAVLAQEGKSGIRRVAQATKIATSMPQQDWQAAIAKGATGRQLAMQRRMVQSLAGRATTASQAARPAGRQRARMVVPAPAKVEEGHTLSGGTVTGTMVERSKKVTGNEPGSCRPITGTEYIGTEQYQTLCNTKVEPMPAKVGVSSTLREHKVTGTEVGRSQRVTGDEVGACRGITGTEYLAGERYQEFCDSRPQPPVPKVGQMTTAKGHVVSGVVVGRSEHVTGDESGADRAITGTGYSQPADATGAPEKVAVTHTAQGKPVTGTAVGHTGKITGDETGACRGITGTEYLAAEQFQDICSTTPPTTPRKVSVMSTRGNQSVSGTEVGRSAKVTGNETGSCLQITGSQYFKSGDFGELCNVTGPRKVGAMQTLAGRTVTGTEVNPSPKMSGDEAGGCIPVTGSDYVGAQQQAACAGSTQVAPVAKVAVDQTWRGQPVTGAYVGRSSRVTGTESGGCAPISGTPYIGRGQYDSFCASPALLAQEARIRSNAIIPSTAVTGDRPGAGGSVMTGDERGACEPVSGTPYVGADNVATPCPTSGRFVSRVQAWTEPARPAAPMDFSISTPARTASQQRLSEVTGAAYSSDRITGPVNKANGLITGTPEFRHRDATTPGAGQDEVIPAARRLTGEGSQDGRAITGDTWNLKGRVTGTEGASSLSRNPSARGNPRGMGMSAPYFREAVEHPAPAESRITGSSGTTSKGAMVTLSGGARG